MRIDKTYSPQLQRDLRDIKHKLESLDVSKGQGGRVITTGTRPKPMDVTPIQSQPTSITELASGVVNGNVSINGTLVVNGHAPLFHVAHTVADYSAAGRAIGTIYQNTGDNSLDVRVSIDMS